MSKLSRRKLLQGMGYGLAALTTGVLPALALAGQKSAGITATTADAALPSCDITIYQQKSIGRESVSLLNLTDKAVRLDSIEPVGLVNVNEQLSVRLNQVADGAVVLQPGERLSFEIEAISKASPDDSSGIPNVVAGHVRIRSNHPAFNGKVPVTVFDSQLA